MFLLHLNNDSMSVPDVITWRVVFELTKFYKQTHAAALWKDAVPEKYTTFHIPYRRYFGFGDVRSRQS
jgi:hypothetical protein